jgi:peptidoglycan/LPS O-acetylase OafA/YrhL
MVPRVELQFYLFFPLLVAWVRPERLPRYLMAILIAAPLLRIATYPLSPDWAYYVLMPCRADSLAAGALIAWAFCDARTTAWLNQRRKVVRRAALGALAGFPLLWVIPNSTLSLHMMLWGHTYLTVLFATILLGVLVHAGHRQLWVLRTRCAAGVAAISYALYMLHPAALLLLSGGQATLAHVLTALAITLAACVASYFLLEQPALRIGRSVQNRILRRARPARANKDLEISQGNSPNPSLAL